MIRVEHIEGSLYENATWYGLPSGKNLPPRKSISKEKPSGVDYSEGCLTIFKNAYTTDNAYYCTLSDVALRIKNGNSKGLVEKIRETKDEKFKRELPSICFSGIFMTRNNASLIKHSGYVVLDYDDLPDVNKFKEHICKCKYVAMAFTSPTGTGLKVVVKINPSDHVSMCEQLGRYFPSDCLDLHTDVSRVCFESYDPDVYFNNNALMFNG